VSGIDRLDTLTQQILDAHVIDARASVRQAFELGYEVGERAPRPAPRCQFYDVAATEPGIVVQDVDHPLSVEDAAFFVPVTGGGAVRVHVCAEHLRQLEETYKDLADGVPS
jgi:hypothetical protein